MIGVLGEPGGALRLLVMLGDGRRLVAGELTDQEHAVGAQVAGRLREPHPGRSVVRWLQPVLAVLVELEAGQVRRTALPAADG
ncbi:hypothetical protein ACFVSN_35920 [Kitasatospora sp. NPDC057904]|uniref:hypothetical protein n=1 Tax=unclassified Kitasatospora TaxID=2633591 RepID=UPI0036DEF718